MSSHDVGIKGRASRVGVLILALVWAGRAVAFQSPPGTTTAAPGEVATEEATRIQGLLHRLEDRRKTLHIPGLAVAIVHADRVVTVAGLGEADLETHRPVDGETLFAIGSATKAFTATLVAIAMQDGHMSWDDPVTAHLPEFRFSDPKVTEQATIRDLLSHRTGLMRTDLIWYGGHVSREDLLNAVGEMKLRKPFREAWQYNNVMFVVVGEALRRAMHADWDSLADERLFVPLGMNHSQTSFEVFRTNPAVAKGYDWDEDSKSFEARPPRDLTVVAPAGAIVSNADDMARWVRFQLGRGTIDGEEILPGEVLETLWEQVIPLSPGDAATGYGMGWMSRTLNGRRIVEHGGNIDGFAAQVGFFPGDDLGFVLLTNVSATALQSEMASLVEESMLSSPGKQDAEDPTSLDAYVGQYYFEPFKSNFKVLVQSGRLAVDVPGQTVYELRPPDESGKWTFALTDAIAVAFDRDDAGVVTGLRLYQNGLTFELPREGYVAPVEVTEDQAQPFLGQYRADVVNGVVTVLRQNGRLAVDVPGQMIYELHKPGDDGRWVFRATDTIAVSFEIQNGRAERMTLHQSGVDSACPRVEDGTDSKEALKAILARHREVYGSANVAAAYPMILKGKIELPHQGVQGREEIMLLDESHLRDIQDLGVAGRVETVVTDEWLAARYADRVDKIDQQGVGCTALLESPVALAADWSGRFSAELVRHESVDESPCTVVRLKRDCGGECLVWIDEGSGRLVKQEFSLIGLGQPTRTVVRFSDWRIVNGILIPFRVESDDEAMGTVIRTLESVETGREMDASLFGVPAAN